MEATPDTPLTLPPSALASSLFTFPSANVASSFPPPDLGEPSGPSTARSCCFWPPLAYFSTTYNFSSRDSFLLLHVPQSFYNVWPGLKLSVSTWNGFFFFFLSSHFCRLRAPPNGHLLHAGSLDFPLFVFLNSPSTTMWISLCFK